MCDFDSVHPEEVRGKCFASADQAPQIESVLQPTLVRAGSSIHAATKDQAPTLSAEPGEDSQHLPCMASCESAGSGGDFAAHAVGRDRAIVANPSASDAPSQSSLSKDVTSCLPALGSASEEDASRFSRATPPGALVSVGETVQLALKRARSDEDVTETAVKRHQAFKSARPAEEASTSDNSNLVETAMSEAAGPGAASAQLGGPELAVDSPIPSPAGDPSACLTLPRHPGPLTTVHDVAETHIGNLTPKSSMETDPLLPESSFQTSFGYYGTRSRPESDQRSGRVIRERGQAEQPAMDSTSTRREEGEVEDGDGRDDVDAGRSRNGAGEHIDRAADANLWRNRKVSDAKSIRDTFSNISAQWRRDQLEHERWMTRQRELNAKQTQLALMHDTVWRGERANVRAHHEWLKRQARVAEEDRDKMQRSGAALRQLWADAAKERTREAVRHSDRRREHEAEIQLCMRKNQLLQETLDLEKAIARARDLLSPREPSVAMNVAELQASSTYLTRHRVPHTSSTDRTVHAISPASQDYSTEPFAATRQLLSVGGSSSSSGAAWRSYLSAQDLQGARYPGEARAHESEARAPRQAPPYKESYRR